MSLVLETDPLPLAMDDGGVVRVGGTRVSLDTIVICYQQGATAEEISQQYPSVSLPDIHGAIGFYLRRPAEVEAYLAERAEQARSVRSENEARFPGQGIRDRLLARQAAEGNNE